ncbi:MAG: iron ABC transporter permease [Chlamydiales bacterium]
MLTNLLQRNVSFLIFFTAYVVVLSGLVVVGDAPWEYVWGGVIQRLSGLSTKWNPLLDERLPRIVVLLLSGASLATAGASMQALFQNPLASPNILGLSSGGSLATVIVLAFGWHFHFPLLLPLAATCGSLATILLVYGFARSRGIFSNLHVILTGIAFSSVLVAIQQSLLYILRDHWELIQTVTEWEAGTSFDRSWHHVNMQLPLTFLGLIGCYHYRREMNVIALGEEEASLLGVNLPQVRWRLILCISLLTGSALAGIGPIAFFGLLLPHIVRKFIGFDHRRVILYCIFAGSLVMAGMDLLIRLCSITLFTMGNISSLIGGLFFLTLLLKKEDPCSKLGA